MKRSMMTAFGVSSATLLMATALYAGPTDDPGIRKREQTQQKRIEQGVESGQLTPKEAGRLENREAKIRQNEERMKADGKLTKRERRKLGRELNTTSKQIYKKKHNEQRVNVGQ